MNLDGQQGLASNAMPKAVNSSSARKKRVQGRCWDLMEDLDVQVPLEAPRGDPPGSYRQIAESSVAADLVAPPMFSSEAPHSSSSTLPSGWSPAAPGCSEDASSCSSSGACASTSSGRPPPPFGSPEREMRRSECLQHIGRNLENLSPAAREAADVSCMVRQRAADSLRGLGLRGELRPLIPSGTKVDLGSPEPGTRETKAELAQQETTASFPTCEAWTVATEEAAGCALQHRDKSQDPLHFLDYDMPDTSAWQSSAKDAKHPGPTVCDAM